MEIVNKMVESSNSCVNILLENIKDLERIVTWRDFAIAATNAIQDSLWFQGPFNENTRKWYLVMIFREYIFFYLFVKYKTLSYSFVVQV